MNRGFTLVEVVVSLVIISLVGLITTTLFISITGYQTRKNELNNIKNAIHNIHEVYLSDPKSWEERYYGIHGYALTSFVDNEGVNILYFTQHFESLDTRETRYAIYYEFTFADGIYRLQIVKVTKDNKIIDENIDLGRWVEDA